MVEVKLILEKEKLEKKVSVINYENLVEKRDLVFKSHDPKWSGKYKIKKVEQVLDQKPTSPTGMGAYFCVNVYLKKK